jgi:hypothetical protein
MGIGSHQNQKILPNTTKLLWQRQKEGRWQMADGRWEEKLKKKRTMQYEFETPTD